MSYLILAFLVSGIVNAQVGATGYFRPESPWLPGTRKVVLDEDPAVELRSYVTHSIDENLKSSSVKVTELSASWTNEENKMVFKRITFNLDHVSPIS